MNIYITNKKSFKAYDAKDIKLIIKKGIAEYRGVKPYKDGYLMYDGEDRKLKGRLLNYNPELNIKYD